jgi:tetratricopeptide (TPR) repeat protein
MNNYSKNSSTDSMYKRLNKCSLKDSAAIINKLILHCYITAEEEKGFELINLSNALILKITEERIKINMLNTMGIFYSFYNYNNCKHVSERAIKLADKAGDNYGKALALFNLGVITMSYDYFNAIEYYMKSLDISQKYKINNLTSYNLSAIGDAFRAMGNYSDAMKYLFEAERIFQNTLNSYSTEIDYYQYGNMLNCFGGIYKSKKDWSNALKYYELFQKNSQRNGDLWNESISFNNLGDTYRELGQIYKAVKSYNKSLEFVSKIDDSSFWGYVYLHLGISYTILKNVDVAQNYYYKADSVFNSFEDKEGESILLIEKARLEYSKNNIIKSLANYEKALSYFQQKNENDKVLFIYQSLSELYEKRGYYKKSLEFNKLFLKLNDSVFNINKSEEIGALKATYQFEKKIEDEKRKKEIEEAKELQIKNRKNLIQYIGISIGFIIIFSLIVITGRYKIKLSTIESMIFVTFLFFFEFILLLLDPILSQLTNGEPVFSVIVYALVALAFTPLDTFSESKLRSIAAKRK